MIADSIAVDELLLILKVAFLVLLYLFIWRIVRSASRDIRSPNESFVIAPGPGLVAESPGRQSRPGRLVVLKSPTLPQGEDYALNSAPLTVGRGERNDIELRGDGFASAAHARFEARGDGVWLEDAGSTNGTFVNGIKLSGPRKLTGGDIVRVGETDLRYEA
ncbi:MAG: FHA domain-containing protein [Gaiellaceae bacterium]